MSPAGGGRREEEHRIAEPLHQILAVQTEELDAGVLVVRRTAVLRSPDEVGEFAASVGTRLQLRHQGLGLLDVRVDVAAEQILESVDERLDVCLGERSCKGGGTPSWYERRVVEPL